MFLEMGPSEHLGVLWQTELGWLWLPIHTVLGHTCLSLHERPGSLMSGHQLADSV